ncbi:N-glycosylase/DNA lyase [Candidatus Woesearchaeota archaeon]|nr:N-glycosylase/DNA lyase [Candidatus Woesearchaeota archaeon]
MYYKDLDYLKQAYSQRKEIIQNRLKYFKSVWNEDEKRIFAELCFCLLTPQSKAKLCDAAIQNLVKTNLLFTGKEQDIKDYLIGVRFNNNKSRYITEARNMFTKDGKIFIKDKIKQFDNELELRNWLVENVNGIGLKEAGHFMRNIGMYENVSILDRHILKNLHKHGVIDEIPNPLTKKQYLEIEEKMKLFCKEVGIGIEEIDLLFWSEETGEVFK